MEKTGSINKVLGLIEELDKNDIIKSASKVIIAENVIYKEMTAEIIALSKSKNIAEILNFERAILKYEQSKCDNIPANSGRITSLETAIKDLDKAKTLIDIVKDTKKYSEHMVLYADKTIDKINGIPRDAFHRFIDSHKTRLGNRLIHDDGSYEKKNFIKIRHESMQTIKKEYMKLQSKALTIPLPEKSREIER